MRFVNFPRKRITIFIETSIYSYRLKYIVLYDHEFEGKEYHVQFPNLNYFAVPPIAFCSFSVGLKLVQAKHS